MSDFTRLRCRVQESRHARIAASEAEAFVRLCLEVFLQLSDGEISRAVTLGEDDGGMAALAVCSGGEREGVHVVFSDWVEKERHSRRLIGKRLLGHFADTFLAIVSSRDDELELNQQLRRQIAEVKAYWARCDSTYIPHTIYFFTNREEAGIRRAWIEHHLNYYMDHRYRYYEQEDLAVALLGD